MGFLNKFKKDDVPDELPDLIEDKIDGGFKSGGVQDTQPGRAREMVGNYLQQEEMNTSPNVEDTMPAAEGGSLSKRENDWREMVAESTDKNFFDELERNITKEVNDLDELESWYNEKFLPQDVVSEMRNYWENQKNNVALKFLGKDVQAKILEKTEILQNLEKEWQSIYFDLIAKEEEIKEKEIELKKLLGELIEIFKRRTKPDYGGN